MNHSVLTLTPEGFRTAPLDQAIHTIRTWTEAPWPLTWENAFRIRDNLGWVSSLHDEEVVSTTFGLMPENGSLTGGDGFLHFLRFRLTDAFTPGTVDVRNETSAAFNRYAHALTQLYGQPTVSTHRGGTAATWTLPTGVGLSLTLGNHLIQVFIESPEFHAIEDLEDEE